MLELLLRWVTGMIAGALAVAAQHPVVGVVARTALVIAGLLIGARIVYSLFARYAPPRFARHSSLASSRATDWRATARELATSGDFTAAAHALYLALLTSIAQQGLVLLDESKTTGDYLRELRQRTHDAANTRWFDEFTRSYEVVIYGAGVCDSERYSKLDSLAGTLLGSTR